MALIKGGAVCACVAVTIARIREGAVRALARPEVKAKMDAWNQSRVGSTTPEHIKVLACNQILAEEQMVD